MSENLWFSDVFRGYRNGDAVLVFLLLTLFSRVSIVDLKQVNVRRVFRENIFIKTSQKLNLHIKLIAYKLF